MVISGLFILSISASIASCSSDIAEESYKILNDTTTTLVSATEPNSYDIYYKPAVGYVGDPMPFYDSQSGSHFVMYLQDGEMVPPLTIQYIA